MIRKLIGISSTLTFALMIAQAADIAPARSNMNAADIVARNVEARGGLQAWRKVQSLSMQGKLGAGGNQRNALPLPLPEKNGSKLALPPRPAEEAPTFALPV